MESIRSVCCEGEKCFCGNTADFKVEETIFHDDWSVRDDGPNGHMPREFRGRHPLTAYVCGDHFAQIMRTRSNGSPPVAEVAHQAWATKPDRLSAEGAQHVGEANSKPTEPNSSPNSEQMIAELCEALEDLIAVQQYATGWDNGVVEGGHNEADHHHGKVMERAEATLARAKRGAL